MIKRLICTIALFSVIVNGEAQIKWPVVNPVTKPWARWWWPGSAVNTRSLSANMNQYAQAGLGGLEITPIYGVAGYESEFIDYLSPQWMQVFSYTLAEAKKLNLQIDMATGSGWPFGGGPLIGDAEACKEFVYKTWTVKKVKALKSTLNLSNNPTSTLLVIPSLIKKELYPTVGTVGKTTLAMLKESEHVKDVKKLARAGVCKQKFAGTGY